MGINKNKNLKKWKNGMNTIANTVVGLDWVLGFFEYRLRVSGGW